MAFFGKVFLPKNAIFFLFLSVYPVGRGGHAGDALEDPGEVIRIGVAAGKAHLPDVEPGAPEQLPGPGDPVY